MTTPQEIENQVYNQDIIPYQNSIYDGYISEELIEQFRIAMMYIPATSHKYSMEDVDTIRQRKPDEVTVRELGMILNAVYAVPFISMYGSLEEGIEKTKGYDKIKDKYNQSTAAFERKCQAKMNRLLKLSGVGNSAPLNGMKIIP